MSQAADMVLLEQALSGRQAQDCALKVQQLPMAQQYSVHSSCVVLSALSASTTTEPQEGAGAAALLVLGALFISLVIYALKEGGRSA